jgi:hypothetical protein
MSRVPPRIVAAPVTVGAGLVAPPAAHADTSPVQRTVNALVSQNRFPSRGRPQVQPAVPGTGCCRDGC